jgi:branched-chain amino acid transport system ATP-binding protein
MLNIEGLSVKYGAVPALHDIFMKVNQGEFVTLIGANGAGKTTMLKAISGLLKFTGDISFEGRSFANSGTRTVLSSGIAHCPEGRRVFPHLTVTENLLMGAYLRKDGVEVQKDIGLFFERFPRLGERRWQAAGTLSGGEQQMLAIARALMSRPKMVLFDEPSLGLAPNIVQQTFEFISSIRKQGTTVLMVEQNALAALELSDRAYLISSGRMVQEGPSAEILANPKIREAYLGG